MGDNMPNGYNISNEDNLLSEFNILAIEYFRGWLETDIFNQLSNRRNNSTELSSVLKLLRGIMADFKNGEKQTPAKKESINYIFSHIVGVKTLEELDHRLVLLNQGISRRKEETDISIKTIIHKMEESSDPACQLVASAYNREGIYAAIMAVGEALLSSYKNGQGEEAPSTIGRGHI